MLENFVWAEKYRPKKLDECVFPDSLYDTFYGWIESGQIPDVILTGTPGIGKTTVAKAVINEIGSEWYKINGSLEGDKEQIRTNIFQFASTVSLGDVAGKKYVLVDEADGMTHEAQKALRGFMDEYGRNCGFIFTANFPQRIIEPIHSRTQTIQFRIDKEERPALMERVYKRMVHVLKKEGVRFDPEALSHIVVDRFPDIRATLNELQRIYNRDGDIKSVDSGSFDEEIAKVISWLKARDFASLRNWSAETHMEFHVLARALFNKAPDFATKDTIPALIILIGEYQHKASLVVDQEINMAAFLAQAMNEVEFK